MRGILAEEPIACQSMFYYKPPGARGQAFHQDNFYLAVQPQSCLAAWIATEQVDEENGCLYLCPGTHELDLQCPELAEEEQSFTTHIVRPPAGTKPVAAVLAPGDTLFFNGSVVHGSQPNRSARWRRSFIGHYMPASSRAIGKSFQPGVDFAGSDVRFKASGGTEACGEEFAPSAFWENYRQGRPSSEVPSA